MCVRDTFLSNGTTKSKLSKDVLGPLGELRKFLNRVLVPHGFVALGTNRAKIVEVRGAPFAVRDVVAHLEIKGGQGIFTPIHVTLLLKVPVSKVPNPNLLTKGTWNLLSWHDAF